MGTRERRKKTRAQQKIAKYRNKQRLIAIAKKKAEMEALEKLLNGSISKLNEIVSDNQIGIFSMKSP